MMTMDDETIDALKEIANGPLAQAMLAFDGIDTYRMTPHQLECIDDIAHRVKDAMTDLQVWLEPETFGSVDPERLERLGLAADHGQEG